MSRKISEYFKILPKVDEKTTKNLDCKVVLTDIKNLLQEIVKLNY